MLSLIIPVYNEETILKDSVFRLRDWLAQQTIDFELIVVDNGSSDRTAEIARRLEKEFPWFRFFHIPQRSVGKAFACGVLAARSSKIVSLDADLSSDLVFIQHADKLLQDAEMVVGSKSLGQQKRSLLRIFGSQIYLLITQVLFGMAITDFSMGAKAYRREVLLPILDEIDDWTAYVFEICVWLTQHQKRVVQIGIFCEDLRQSHFNIWHEGFYRYQNLFRVWRELKNSRSWFHRISAP